MKLLKKALLKGLSNFLFLHFFILHNKLKVSRMRKDLKKNARLYKKVLFEKIRSRSNFCFLFLSSETHETNAKHNYNESKCHHVLWSERIEEGSYVKCVVVWNVNVIIMLWLFHFRRISFSKFVRKLIIKDGWFLKEVFVGQDVTIHWAAIYITTWCRWFPIRKARKHKKSQWLKTRWLKIL